MGLARTIRRWFGHNEPTTLGGRGEQAAADHLKQAGYRILARNHQTGIGEIDILAEDLASGMLVVVEVKTARGDAPPPEVHVNTAKQRKLAQLAACLAKQRRFADRAIRFDVVGVVWPDGAAQPTRITHHRGAFESHR
jgi:putative endonuclease